MKHDLNKQIRTVTNQLARISFEATQAAIEKGANALKSNLESATNTSGSGAFKQGWKVQKYPNSAFIYNDRTVPGYGRQIPLTNIAEYSRTGPAPFIQSVAERSQGRVLSEIKLEYQKSIRRKS